jgi:hypothetical protein
LTYTAKTLEQVAFTMLEKFVKERFPGASMRNTMNKGSVSRSDVADAVLTLGGRDYLIEIKASTKKPSSNLRFTHQTVTKAIGKDVIVALISQIATGDPTFEFFRLSDVVDQMIIEPAFLIPKTRTKAQVQELGDILELPDAVLDVTRLLDSPVRDYTHLRGAGTGQS